MVKTPINNGLAQSDVDLANFKPLRADLSGYAGSGLIWNATTKKFDVTGIPTSGTITLSVKAAPYNAAGDGVTDDTTAIQTAINDLYDMGGGTLFFPRGTYLCNGALDAVTNSVLRLPIQNNFSGPMTVGIELLGEIWTGSMGWGSWDNAKVSAITTTTAASGTYPAIFAANAFTSGDYQSTSLFNNIMLRVRNLIFLTPTMSGLRLDSCGYAILNDVFVLGPGGFPPTAGTVGIWMPKTGNTALAYANGVWAYSYDTGIRVGEHFRSPNFVVSECNTGMEFTFANESSYANGLFNHCVHNVYFSDSHAVDVFADIEYANPAAADGVMVTTADVYDPSNVGGGVFRYNIIKADVGIVEDDALVTGGNKMTLVNLHKGKITMGPTGSISGNGAIPPGGTTGQSLKKLSNTDYDVGWG